MEDQKTIIVGSVGEPPPPFLSPEMDAAIDANALALKEAIDKEVEENMLREMYASAAKKGKHGHWASYSRCKVCGYICSGKSKKLVKISDDIYIHKNCYEIMKRKLLAEAKARVEAPVVEPKKEEIVEQN